MFYVGFHDIMMLCNITQKLTKTKQNIELHPKELKQNY